MFFKEIIKSEKCEVIRMYEGKLEEIAELMFEVDEVDALKTERNRKNNRINFDF